MIITTPLIVMFQFHTGSIKRRLVNQLRDGELCFNSILVRLKGDEDEAAIAEEEQVSIPYWFD